MKTVKWDGKDGFDFYDDSGNLCGNAWTDTQGWVMPTKPGKTLVFWTWRCGMWGFAYTMLDAEQIIKALEAGNVR